MADEDFKKVTADYDRTNATSFIKSYINEKTNFGNVDAKRRDSFDEKQSAMMVLLRVQNKLK